MPLIPMMLCWITIAGFAGITWALGKPGAGGKTKIMRGVASYYSDELAGRPMANGEKYNATNYVAAMWNVPLGTLVKVRSLKTGRFVFVKICDRGPARRLNRVIDLSRAAFKSIGELKDGLTEVEITY